MDETVRMACAVFPCAGGQQKRSSFPLDRVLEGQVRVAQLLPLMFMNKI